MNRIGNSTGKAGALLEQLEAVIAECDQLKKENEKLRSDLNSAVMHLIQNKGESTKSPNQNEERARRFLAGGWSRHGGTRLRTA
jgi:regulator of replication initiation timing